MADKKISALPAATTPLAGTEVLPVVQGGVTDQVSVDNLTAGRDVSVKKLNATDDVVIGTAGKGIDFSANGGDVLSQYDEGVWTPVVTASSGSITSYTSSGRYTRVGRMVTAVLTFKLTNAGTASGAIIATLPFSTDAGITYIGCGRDDNLGSMLQGRVITAIPGSVYITTYANASIAVTNTEVFFTIQYFV